MMSENNSNFFKHSSDKKEKRHSGYVDPSSFDAWLAPEPELPQELEPQIKQIEQNIEAVEAVGETKPSMQTDQNSIAYAMKLIAYCAAAIVIIFAAWLVVRPKTEYSEQENRYLTQWPEFSLAALADGSYLSDIDDYLADQFPLRDFFVNVNTQFSLLLGKREINDIYICEDGYLIESYASVERTELIIRAFNRLDENVESAKVTLMLIPTAITVYEDRLPYGVNPPSQIEDLETIYYRFNGTTVDVASALMEQRENYQLFYRTDHHWTTYGAYFGYTALCRALGIEAEAMSDYTITNVSDSFCGTIYSKVNDYSMSGDSIDIFESSSWENITVKYEDTGVVSDSPYDLSYLEGKDKYSMFLSNIHPLVTITNPNVGSGRAIAVIKDSYANCLVPFLINHYSTIYVFDTRYYQGDVSEFINEHSDITDAVIVYNMNTMDTDTGTTKIR